MGFREDYSKFQKPSLEREAFVLKAISSLPKSQIISAMKPITVTRPDGAKITYKVMPDYLMIDGMRVPMSGNSKKKYNVLYLFLFDNGDYGTRPVSLNLFP